MRRSPVTGCERGAQTHPLASYFLVRSSWSINTSINTFRLFGVLGFRRLTGSALLDCHVLNGFGIYMIGILDSLSDVWKGSTATPPCKLLRVNTLR